MLCPDYNPPFRGSLGGDLLGKITDVKADLADKRVTTMQDGWSDNSQHTSDCNSRE